MDVHHLGVRASTSCPGVWVIYRSKLARSISGDCIALVGCVGIDGWLASFSGLEIVADFIALLGPNNASEAE